MFILLGTARWGGSDGISRRDGGMGVIGHNRETLAICFFSVENGTPVDGFVPGSRDAGYEEARQSSSVVAADGCQNCHRADPFLQTPWIDPVRDPADPGSPLVPLIASEDSLYPIVGDEFFQPVAGHLPGDACSSWHRSWCVPGFFNVQLDPLEMPVPFYAVHRDRRKAADRAALRAWGESLDIRCLGG